MDGLFAKKRGAHETHLGYKSRSMYHVRQKLVKPFFPDRSFVGLWTR